jgi:type IV pilus assembly protein PilY1
MTPRVLGFGFALALGACMILAGASTAPGIGADAVADVETTADAEVDAAPSAMPSTASAQCFDSPLNPPRSPASPPATDGARRSMPGRSLLSFPAGPTAGALFQSEHDWLDWSGSVKKFSVALDAAGQIDTGALLWDGGALLTSMPASLRQIYTLRADPGRAHRTLPFKWPMLSSQQRAALDLAPSTSLGDALGERRLDFLRGERSLEIGQSGGIFRRRASVMGDPSHGGPLLVGAPSAGITGAQYGAFFERHAKRPATLYLGANDGMLHAFDAANGRELFAYVPNLVWPWLNRLTSPDYRHQAYVDGDINAAEAMLDGQWKTVLVAGLGGGAPGLFALDVSAPDRFGQGSGALWEFGSADDAAIGHVAAAPLIAKFGLSASPGAASQRYFALLSSGVDQEKGALFLLALDKSASVRWRSGVNYYKLALPLPSAALGPPALALGPDAAVRYIYAGDLEGNLWRFDFFGRAPANAAVQLLFVARDASGLRQPITQAPSVAFAPDGGYLVLFGTGKLRDASDSDPAHFTSQSFYAIHDRPGQHDQVAIKGRAALAGIDPLASAAASAKAEGWYLDFPQSASGERSIGGSSLAAGKVFFNTISPGSAPCTVAAARSYALDALTGLAAGVARRRAMTVSTNPVPQRAAPVLLEMAGEAGPRQATGRMLVRQRHLVLDAEGVAQTSRSTPAQRLNWREIANWPELHQTAKQNNAGKATAQAQ